MKVIHKFPLSFRGRSIIQVPKKRKVVLVGNDSKVIACIWIEFDQDDPKHDAFYQIVGTGTTYTSCNYVHVGSLLYRHLFGTFWRKSNGNDVKGYEEA